jgi:formylglycine-generating enzyme required for sulfatase activity
MPGERKKGFVALVATLQRNADGGTRFGGGACGSYGANASGLHDMHGNEFEWCRDWYHAQLPGGADPDLSGAQGLPNRDGTYSRLRRGGAWTDSETFCRSALRLRYEPERRADHIGFRVVVVRL